MILALLLRTVTLLLRTVTLPLLLIATVILSFGTARSVVPALVFDIGPRVWWPSALARKEETRYRRGEADSVSRTEERHPERPAALAASETPDGPN